MLTVSQRTCLNSLSLVQSFIILSLQTYASSLFTVTLFVQVAPLKAKAAWTNVCAYVYMYACIFFFFNSGGRGENWQKGGERLAISLLGKEELCFLLLLLLLVCFWCPKHFLSHNNVLYSIVCLRIGREMGKACLRGTHLLTQISFRKELYRSWGSGN